ncbi:DNA-binding response regulator [Collibacillus ludicampi]|uniref:DNA-binding response regulator n=1 Tax=Collibacillus ludicampi TaxID=2771369 RepID=A0AAV4LD96_9BACL|nr:response regulator transcription factor [Collibacillus ludicampi]GIM45720.1 DNA-binding response regulator [Collibacillus ludicampi]
MRILLFSKNQSTVSLFRCILTSHKIEVYHVTDREQIESMIQRQEFIAVVLDLPNPTMDDLLYWRNLLHITPIPVLTISSDTNEVNRVLLRQQASIHLTEPLANVLLRLHQVHSTTHQGDSLENCIELAPQVIFDITGHCIINHGERLPLSSTEFKLLYILTRNMGQTFKADELIHLANLIGPSSLYVHIQRLREKIEKDPRHPTILVTKRGKGYKIQLNKLLSSFVTIHSLLYVLSQNVDFINIC